MKKQTLFVLSALCALTGIASAADDLDRQFASPPATAPSAWAASLARSRSLASCCRWKWRRCVNENTMQDAKSNRPHWNNMAIRAMEELAKIAGTDALQNASALDTISAHLEQPESLDKQNRP